jgi:hypothetical protein
VIIFDRINKTIRESRIAKTFLQILFVLLCLSAGTAYILACTPCYPSCSPDDYWIRVRDCGLEVRGGYCYCKSVRIEERQLSATGKCCDGLACKPTQKETLYMQRAKNCYSGEQDPYCWPPLCSTIGAWENWGDPEEVWTGAACL